MQWASNIDDEPHCLAVFAESLFVVVFVITWFEMCCCCCCSCSWWWFHRCSSYVQHGPRQFDTNRDVSYPNIGMKTSRIQIMSKNYNNRNNSTKKSESWWCTEISDLWPQMFWYCFWNDANTLIINNDWGSSTIKFLYESNINDDSSVGKYYQRWLFYNIRLSTSTIRKYIQG